MKKKSKFLTTLALVGVCAVTPFLMVGCGPEKLTDYSITYELNGGTNNSSNPEIFNEKTNTFVLSNPTKEGYSFDGWFKDPDFEEPITSIEIGTKEDITIYAKWNINQYTISFVTNGGTQIQSITQDYNSTITAPTNPTKDGYVFVDWYTNSSLTNKFTFNKMPSQNLTLYAKYEALFNVNGNTITGLSSYAKSHSSCSDIVIPARIDGYNITKIAKGAFQSSLITSVVIGPNVNTIEEFAFGKCNRLENVILPDNVTTIGTGIFYQCSGLESVQIGNGITTLTEGFCNGCSNLMSVTFGQNIKTIGNIAFASCSKLTSVELPNSVENIEVGAFGECPILETVTIGSSLKSLKNEAFLNDKKLTTINLPDSLLSIGDKVFRGCTNLKNIIIPANVTSIGDYAFEGDNNLLDVVINSNTLTLGTYTFSECSKLKDVTFKDTSRLTSMGKYCFYSCSALEEFVLPAGLTTIPLGAFYKCSNLNNLKLHSNLTTIEEDGFASCSSLQIIELPNGIRTIGANAFSACTNLSYIYIPSSVTTISSTRTLFSTTLNNASCSPFYNDNKLTIYCAKSSKTSGYDTYWNYKQNGVTVNTLWNKTIDDFNTVAHPYKETVEQINNSLNDGKTILNDVANNTLSANIAMLYEDGTLFEFNKTKNFICWTTENYEYLDLYKSGTNLMYSADYNEEDLANCYILVEDVSVIEEDAFDYRVKNRLHIIPEVTDYISKIEAVESFDYYTIKVTITFAPESSFVIEYKVKDNKINGMNIDGEEVRFYTSNNNYTYNSAKFSSLTKLTIDKTFIEDTSIVDFTMLENVDTVEISPSLTVPEYVSNNFTLTGTEGNFKVYTKNK